ncbi:MAG: hypothetical protein C0506_04930 [Anaerolinea sp.]|nr:hypothetical protein [Anaerolinea sp.]
MSVLAMPMIARAPGGLWGSLFAVRLPVQEEAAPAGVNSEASRLKSREPDAWRQLFEREMPAIYRYAQSRLANASEAEDATSQVFAEAWEHAEAFRDQGLPARAWLFGIARNVVNSHRRRWFGRPPAVAIEAFDGAAADPGLDSDLIDLAHSLSLLEPAHAEVVSLRFIHGLSLQETAIALGTSVDGVKGRQARALARLRDHLQEPS